jgi:hypothetical protein
MTQPAPTWLDRALSGANAYTTTTASFVQPAAAAPVSVSVVDTSWMVVGQGLFVAAGGAYTVSSIASPTGVVLVNTGATGNAAAAASVPSGGKVSPAGLPGANGAAGPDNVIKGVTVSAAATAAGQAYERGASTIDPVWARPAVKVQARNSGMLHSAAGTDNGAIINSAIGLAAAAQNTLSGAEGGKGGRVEIEGGSYYATTAILLDSGASPSRDTMCLSGAGRAGAHSIGNATRLLFNGTTPRSGTGVAATAFDTSTYRLTLTGLSGMSAADANNLIRINGGSVVANRGTFLIATVISATSVTIVNPKGAVDTALNWAMTTSSLLNVYAQDTIVENLSLNTQSGAVLGAGLQCTQSGTAGAQISTNCQYKNLRIANDGGGPMLCGIVWGDAVAHPGQAPYPPDCENGYFEKLGLSTHEFANFYCPNSGGQVKGVAFNMTSFQASRFAANVQSGSFYFYRCDFANQTEAAIKSNACEDLCIVDAVEENCPTFVQGSAAYSGNPYPLRIIGGRLAGNYVVAGVPYISWVGTGTVILAGVHWDTAYNANTKIALGSNGIPVHVFAYGTTYQNDAPYASAAMTDSTGLVVNGVHRRTQIANRYTGASNQCIEAPNEFAWPYAPGTATMGSLGVALGPGGAVSKQRADVALANGNNVDVPLYNSGAAIWMASSYVRVTGPTGVFSIGGMLCYGHLDGTELTVYNATAFAMTLTHEDPGAAAANRISVPGGLSLVVPSKGSARFVYDQSDLRWIYAGGTPTTAWTPVQLPALADYLDARSGFTPASWADLSGAGHPVVQATGANQGSLVASWTNGQPGVLFGASGSMSSAAYAAPLTVHTKLLVGSCDGIGTSAEVAMDGIAAPTTSLYSITGVVNLYAGSNIASSANNSTPKAIAGVFNGASSKIYQGTTLKGSGAAGSDTMTGLIVGAGAGPANFWNGYVGAAIVMGGEISLGDLQNYAVWANGIWGTPKT